MNKFASRTLVGALLFLASFVGMAADNAVYTEHCIACHQPAGAGMPGIAPPLHSTALQGIEPDASVYVVQVLLKGMQGAATDAFYPGVMPPWAFLSDADLASVASYVLQLNGGKTTVTPQKVAEQRQAPMKRSDLKALRNGP